MKRIQFIELHELKWMPKFLRNAVTDFLHVLHMHYQIYSPTISLLEKVMNAIGKTNIIDLCSGGSGPLLDLLNKFKTEYQNNITIQLTDIAPNLNAFRKIASKANKKITFTENPVDARLAIDKVPGIRTFFSSFHHFNNTDAKTILHNTINSQSAICIFEFTENKLSRLLKEIMVPLSVLYLMPKVKPWSLLRFLFVYGIPILPLLITFDSIVSNLRTYTAKQLLAMAQAVNSNDYYWESGTIKSGFKFFHLTYLIGYPK